METNSSGEDVIIRTRKPYTIIKQRERWTAEEHNRFLEALKLYGRAWQRIEEHIGTKTAVQIRSHAQKFFSKLEREASVKGLPIGENHEIKIPPPRPKRKPSNPYPRKLGVSAPTAKDCPVSSTCPGKLVLNTESPTKGYTESDASPIRKQFLKEVRSPEILALFQEAPYASPSSESNIDNHMRGTSSASSPSSFRESMPPKSDSKDPSAGKLDTECGNIISLEIGNLVESDSSGLTIHSTGQLVPENEVDKSEKLGEHEMSQRGNIMLTQGYPRHVPVHVVDMNIARSLELQPPHVTNSGSVATAKEFPSNSAPPALYPAYPILHPPFNPFQANPEALKSAAAYVTSTLPNFIISSVAHNPATHAAANIAASFWPHVMDKESCPNESLKATSNGISYADPCPNLAAVAAATVAAASAWWASQGLVPFCHPYVSFPFAVTPASTAIPVTDVSPCLASDPKEERKETTLLERKQSQMNETMCPAPESPPLSSDSDASACGGSENSKANATYHEPGKLLVSDFQEITKMKTRKQHDHSSCGSNTTSSSEMETDMMHEGIKALDFVHPSGDLSNKRTRSMGNNNESWKEVSEEGRLTFRALFSREVLPQSFSQKDSLQSMSDTKSSNETVKQESKEMESWIEREQNVLIGSKLKGCRMGFKPYKRCLVEAKEITVSRASDRVLKRIHIEEESGNNVIMMPVSGSAGETHCSS